MDSTPLMIAEENHAYITFTACMIDQDTGTTDQQFGDYAISQLYFTSARSLHDNSTAWCGRETERKNVLCLIMQLPVANKGDSHMDKAKKRKKKKRKSILMR